MSLAIITVWPFHTPGPSWLGPHSAIHNYFIQAYHYPCVTTYYSVEAKPHNALIQRNKNNNNIYNLKYTLITQNNLYNKFTLYMATFFSLEKLNHTPYCNSLISDINI